MKAGFFQHFSRYRFFQSLSDFCESGNEGIVGNAGFILCQQNLILFPLNYTYNYSRHDTGIEVVFAAIADHSSLSGSMAQSSAASAAEFRISIPVSKMFSGHDSISVKFWDFGCTPQFPDILIYQRSRFFHSLFRRKITGAINTEQIAQRHLRKIRNCRKRMRRFYQNLGLLIA